MNIFPIHALADNYIWMIEDTDSVVVVDPGEAAEVLSYIKVEKPSQIAILLTHKHDDHIGGVAEIIQAYPETKIYGPSEVPGFDDMTILEDGSQVDILGHTVTALLSAGHTAGHLAYIVDNQFLFSGDAMFSAGCGRVFTGDYQAEFDALETFSRLDDDVAVFAGHEYTLTNLKFAHSVQPNNEVIKEALDQAEKLAASNHPTYPSTIGREKIINIFMQAEDVSKFKKLRDQRDQF
ncbi:hydroxyacylglutathione hydrolase [Aerococcus urinaeequi]|uniref:Hydroxyacylglutathione hydrolase n=1 Tax=Aerococcus urinaeequi TaxID=51665 RepID=A0A7M1KSH9_9LACT|nr:hydroxyacylglutathione hydrolase [Aerococcus urinaeequi]QOQ78838.1 hydroxyacylglutathione hydrolase [Aerococcus urinaeequi]